MKLFIGGPPHSGKTCLREALRVLISRLSQASVYPCYVPANPDGDGRWYVVTAQANVDLANSWKKQAKGIFDKPFADRVISAMNAITAPLVLVDMGGEPAEHDREIASYATHAVILYKENSDLTKWGSVLGSKIIAEVHSTQALGDDSYELATGLLKGIVHGLDFSPRARNSPLIQELARLILDTLKLSDPDSLKTPLADSLSLATAPMGDQSVKGSIINVRLNPDSESGAALVEKAWRLSLDDAAIKASDLVEINGPLTMPVAVALVHRVRAINRHANIAIYDPETPAMIGLQLTGDEPPPQFSSPLEIDFNFETSNGSYDIYCRTTTKSASKATLLQAAANLLRKHSKDRPATSIKISGHMPVMVAAAICLFLSDENTEVSVFDPPSNHYIQVAPK